MTSRNFNLLKFAVVPFLIGTLLFVAAASSLAAVSWNVAGPADWAVGTNWNNGTGPAGDNALINNGGSATLGSAVSNIQNLTIGSAASNSGSLQVNAGASLTATNGGLRTYIGQGGSATMNIAGGALNFNNQILEIGNLSTGSATVTQTAGTVSANNNFIILGREGSADYDISGGTLQTAGTTNNRNTRIHMGWIAGSQASLDLSGTASVISNLNNKGNHNGAFMLAHGGDATLSIADNASLTVNSGKDNFAMIVGGGWTNSGQAGTGLVTQTGGAATLNNGLLVLGGTGTSEGTYDISGGTLNVQGTGDRRALLGWHQTTAKGTLKVGGSAVVNLPQTLIAGGNGQGHIIVDGGQLNVAGLTQIASNASSVSTIELNGGTLTTTQLKGANGTSTATFDGGTLKAATGTPLASTFMQGLTNTYISTGGATFDSNGNNITINQALLHDPALGATQDGGVTKIGSGTLNLTANNTYTGPTTVTGGTLNIAAGGSLASAGNINVINGSTLEINGAITMAPNTYFATGNGVGLASGTTGTTIINNGAVVNLGSSAVLIGGRIGGSGSASVGTLTINGGTVNVGPSSGTSGGADSNNIWLNPYVNGAPSSLNLNGGVLSTARSIRDGSNSGSLVNFDGGTLQLMANNVTIDGNSRINIRDNGAIIDTNGFNTTIGRTIHHSNIGGDNATDGGLTKNGAGTLTLSGVNTFTGDLVINNGNVVAARQVNSSAPTGTALGNMTIAGREIRVNSGGTLTFAANDPIGNISTLQNTSFVIDGGTVTRNNNIFVTMPNITLMNGGTLTGGNGVNGSYQSYNLQGDVTVSGTSGSTITTTGTSNTGIHLAGHTNFDVGVTGAGPDLTVSAPLINGAGGLGAGSFTKTGAGTMVLTTTGTYTGDTTIKAGKLIAGTSNGVTGVSSSSTLLLGDTSGSANATLQLGQASTATYGNNVIVQSGNTGTMTLHGNGNITLTGTTTLGSAGSSGKNLTITNEGSPSWTFHLNGAIQDPAGMTPGTAGTVTVGTIANKGKVQFNAANTYTGDTRIAASPLLINNALALQNSTLDMNAADAGTITFNQDSTLGGLKGSRNLNMTGRTLSIGNNDQSTTYSGALSNGALTKIGTGTLTLSSNASTYTGDTTIKAGTLIAGNANNVHGVSNGSTLLLGDMIGSADAALQLGQASTATYGNNVIVQSGNTGTMKLHGNGNITLNGTTTLGSAGSTGKSLTITNEGHPTWTFNVNGVIQDPVGMTPGTAGTVTVGTIANKGKVRFNAANTYTGSTIVTGSTLDISATGSVNNTANFHTYNGGTTTIEGSVTVADNGIFSIGSSGNGTAGTVIVNNGGTLNIGNGSGGTVGLTFIGGRIGGGGGTPGVGTLTINGGVVNVAAGGTGAGGLDGTRLWLNPYGGTGSTINLNGGTLSTAREIRNGTGGSSTATFNFNGGTLQSAYTGILFGGNGALALNVNAGGAIIDTNGFNSTIQKALLHGSGSPDGGLTKNGTGTLTLTASGTFTGDTTINAGTLNFAGGGSIYNNGNFAGNIFVEQNGTLQFSRHDTFGNANANPAVTITVNGGTVTNGSNAFTPLGNVVLNEGTIDAQAGHTNWDSFLFKGTVSTVAANNPSYMTSTGANSSFHLNSSGTTFNVAQGAAADDLLVSGTLEDYYGTTPGSLVKTGSGTMTLTGSNTYTGTTTINGGTLQVGQGGAGSILSPVTVNSNGTLAGTGVVNNMANATVANSTISPGDNSGSSVGTLTVNGSSTIGTGTEFTDVTQPIVGLTWAQVQTDYLSKGSSLAIQLDPSTTITNPTWDVDELNRAAESDLLKVSDTLNLGDGSILALSFLDEKAEIGTEFNVLDWVTLDGEFDIIVLPLLAEDSWAVIDGDDLIPELGEGGESGGTLLRWDLRDLYTTGVIKVVPEPSTWLLGAMGMFVFMFIRRRK